MPPEFTKDYWEKAWRQTRLPQEVRPRDIPEIHRVLCTLLPNKPLTLIEIGCAPGKWMAYFARQFNYSVDGVDYAAQACEKTRLNMDILSIPARVHTADFFDFTAEPYDVVFSAGFLEHFHQPKSVMDRIVALCRPSEGFVITIIPSMTGLNRWISKTFRPDVAAGHYPIGKSELIALHESCGLQTLYADYTESFHVLPPIQKNRFANRFPRTSFVLNLPVKLWNNSVKSTTRLLGRHPKCGWIAGGVLYVGQRKGLMPSTPSKGEAQMPLGRPAHGMAG